MPIALLHTATATSSGRRVYLTIFHLARFAHTVGAHGHGVGLNTGQIERWNVVLCQYQEMLSQCIVKLQKSECRHQPWGREGSLLYFCSSLVSAVPVCLSASSLQPSLPACQQSVSRAEAEKVLSLGGKLAFLALNDSCESQSAQSRHFLTFRAPSNVLNTT